MFWCVVGLYPDNLQEAWGSGRERRINITDGSFIRRPMAEVPVVPICPFRNRGSSGAVLCQDG